MEANTRNDHAVARRFVGLLSPTRSRSDRRASVRPRTDEPTARLDEFLRDSDAVVLHHVRSPDGGDEINHLVIGPAGITVIDSRNYDSGKARIGHDGIRVGRRNRYDLVEHVLAQVEQVHELLKDTPYADVGIEAALAWRQVEGQPVLHGFNMPRVVICGTRKIAKEAARSGPLSLRRVHALALYLEVELERS